MMDPLSGAQFWLLVKPFERVKELRQRFKKWRAKRKGKAMAVETGLRSSSNMVIAGGVANIVVEVAQMIWPEFVLTPEMRVNLTLAIAWVASRFTKTPSEAKVI
jgi:hypothetical protein